MGIIKTARDDFSAALAAFRAATSPNRNQRRKYVAALVDAGNEWLAKHDAQEGAAPAAFAATRQGQYNTFVDGLPDIALDAVDPQA